jgi:hypothetical protein
MPIGCLRHQSRPIHADPTKHLAQKTTTHEIVCDHVPRSAAVHSGSAASHRLARGGCSRADGLSLSAAAVGNTTRATVAALSDTITPPQVRTKTLVSA